MTRRRPFSLLPDLSARSADPELMDDLHSDPVKLNRTLKQFAVMNAFLTRSRSLTTKVLIPHIAARGNRPVKLVDLGGGGGDYARWVTAYGKRKGLDITCVSMDNDPRVVAFARHACRQSPGVIVVRGSEKDLRTTHGPVNYVFANHLLHHLDDTALVQTLRAVYDSATDGFLLNDLRRSALPYVGYTVFAGLFFRRSFAFYDGRLSIQKGFTPRELRDVVGRIGGRHPIHVGTAFPGRVYVWCLKTARG